MNENEMMESTDNLFESFVDDEGVGDNGAEVDSELLPESERGEESNGESDSDEGASDGADDEGNGADGSEVDTGDFIEISVNDERRTLNRDEAAQYARRGVELDGMYRKLDYLATASGKTVDDLLQGYLDAREAEYRKGLEARVSDPEAVEQLMEVYRTREKEKYEQAVLGRKKAEETARQTREAQIAEDFIKLQKEFPEVADYKSLPPEVKRAAANGENLLNAYLLHLHREGQAVKKAKANAEAAAAASAGSMSDVAQNRENASFSEFKAALFSD